ncbi:hypothetical protein JCM8097_004378 [Rhodosporidiobolus ruineniae]
MAAPNLDLASLALPPDSLILVTGANGFIASHIVLAALQHGYRVRGTVRAGSEGKIEGLKKQWEEAYPGKFEVRAVKDLEDVDEVKRAMDGVSAVAHTCALASGFPSSLTSAAQTTVSLTLSILRAAAATPSVKRVVLTSSVVAARTPHADGIQREVGQESWNDEARERSEKGEKEGDEDFEQKFAVYMASKAEGEKAAWRFVREEKPHFDFSSVLPDAVMGRILDPASQASSAAWIKDLYNGKKDSFFATVPGLWYVNVKDIALLHLGALVLPSAPNTRLFGISGAFNTNTLLSTFRAISPGWDKISDVTDGTMGEEKTVWDRSGSERVLKGMGRSGWRELEETLRENVLEA